MHLIVPPQGSADLFMTCNSKNGESGRSAGSTAAAKPSAELGGAENSAVREHLRALLQQLRLKLKTETDKT
jgi:hypothetical protein